MIVRNGERIFVDTSIFYAVIDADDGHHDVCIELLQRAVAEQWCLVTSNFKKFSSHSILIPFSWSTFLN